MWGFEQLSARERPERQMSLFREALIDCGLEDIGFVGVPFTYNNGREGVANVKVRMDRAVADSNWRDLFADATLRHLVSPRSDHCPLLLEIRKEAWPSRGPRIFRYEIMWERLESLAQEIKEA
jgi:exonuclease III